jgi:hypothetical protein
MDAHRAKETCHAKIQIGTGRPTLPILRDKQVHSTVAGEDTDGA